MAEKWAGVTHSLQCIMKWSVSMQQWSGRQGRTTLYEGLGDTLVLSTLINKQAMSAAG